MSHDSLWVILQKRYQVAADPHSPALNTIGALHAYGKVSELFPIKNGISREGYVLSPTLFTLFNLFFDTVNLHGIGTTPKLWAEGAIQQKSKAGWKPKEDEQRAVPAECGVSR